MMEGGRTAIYTACASRAGLAAGPPQVRAPGMRAGTMSLSEIVSAPIKLRIGKMLHSQGSF